MSSASKETYCMAKETYNTEKGSRHCWARKVLQPLLPSIPSANSVYGKRDLSYGKRDLSYGKRDLPYGKRDLSYGKRDLSYGKRDLSYGKRDL
jgi:hypothetical protein